MGSPSEKMFKVHRSDIRLKIVMLPSPTDPDAPYSLTGKLFKLIRQGGTGLSGSKDKSSTSDKYCDPGWL